MTREEGATSGAGDRTAEARDRPDDEKVPLVRWNRIGIGLALIGVAVVWMAVQAQFGVTGPAPSPPSPTPGRAYAALGTPQVTAGLQANAKVVARLREVGGRGAPAGKEYLLVAVLVINQAQTPLALSPGDFHLRDAGAAIATGVGYPGHDAGLRNPALAAGARAEGDITFVVPRGWHSGLLAYTPSHASTSLLWRIP